MALYNLVDLGTAGTQSGDIIRDAFSKINDNFSLMGELSRCGYYFASYATGFSTTSSSWTVGSTVLTRVPKGDYLVFFSSGLKGNATGCVPNIRLNGSVDGGWGGTAIVYPAPNNMPDYVYANRFNRITLNDDQDIRFEYRRKAGSGTAYFLYQQVLLIGPLP